MAFGWDPLGMAARRYSPTPPPTPHLVHDTPPPIRVGRSHRGTWHIQKRDGRALCGSRASLALPTFTRLRGKDFTWVCASCIRLHLRTGRQGPD